MAAPRGALDGPSRVDTAHQHGLCHARFASDGARGVYVGCMWAHALHAPGLVETRPLRLIELPALSPAAGQVRLRVHACAVCRTDLHVVEGELKTRKIPVIPGHQVVGTVDAVGPDVDALHVGDRVGVAWLHGTCGRCEQCRRGAENLCDQAELTGYSVDGGFAQQMLARAEFVYPLPASLRDAQAAPLLCAGIIGYRALRRTGITRWSGARVGIYGFGAAGHIACQLMRARGADVYVATREQVHRDFAAELGACWVGAALDRPPVPLDAAIIFAPAGELIPAALSGLGKGATLVLAGIHMSDVPAMPYTLLYGERTICSVANNTRADGHAFLAEAAASHVHTHVELFPFSAANDALIALKQRGIRGSALLEVSPGA